MELSFFSLSFPISVFPVGFVHLVAQFHPGMYASARGEAVVKRTQGNRVHYGKTTSASRCTLITRAIAIT